MAGAAVIDSWGQREEPVSVQSQLLWQLTAAGSQSLAAVSVELAVVEETQRQETHFIMLEMNIDTLLQAAEYIERRERGNQRSNALSVQS